MAAYQVQVGDSVSSIAKRYGVPIHAVTGYRSGNPNTIFPGETLTINAPTAPAGPQITPDGAALVAPRGAPSVPAGSAAPVQPSTFNFGVSPGTVQPLAIPVSRQSSATPAVTVQPRQPQQPSPVQDMVNRIVNPPTVWTDAPVTPEPPVAPQVDSSTIETPEQYEPQNDLESLLQTIADSDPETADQIMSALGLSTPQEKSNMFAQYGIAPESVERGFQTNPTGTLSELVKQVMTATGLPDVRSNLETIGKEIEDLANERDAEIAAINDNPFLSAGTKQQRIELLNDKYESRIANRVDRMTLLQNAYTQARQEAQFAVTTAIGLYDKERNFNLDQVRLMLEQEERANAATKNLGFELSPGQTRYQYDPSTGQYRAVAAIPANTGELGGLSKEQRSYLNQIQDNARQDENVKTFPSIRASFETARSAATKQTGTGDIVLMRMIAKITDPTTGVREEEFRTFEGAQSTLARYGVTLTKRMWAGDRLTNEGRLQLYQQAKDIYNQRLAAYEDSVNFYDQQAVDAGLPSGYVMPTYKAPSSTKKSSTGWF